jgi:hypothetical protein
MAITKCRNFSGRIKLVINQRIANGTRHRLPPQLLARADEFIKSDGFCCAALGPLMADTVAKLFLAPGRATLIQNRTPMRKVDSKMLQQYRR